jgi:hypothetical protein
LTGWKATPKEPHDLVLPVGTLQLTGVQQIENNDRHSELVCTVKGNVRMPWYRALDIVASVVGAETSSNKVIACSFPFSLN